ncbi:MAG: hypothetical protein PHT95_02390, partial [Candidatus Omnitrophica bacterium]|nr:hypothetical protein [Candidatus Omnitrophota bacterium]
NPTGFKDRVMIDIPRIYVDYDLPAIIKGNIHLPEVILEMTEFTVVKNESGVLNLDSLNVVKEEKAKKEPAAAEKKPMPGISIDKLVLKIGKVVYKDYSKGGEPQVQEFVIGLDETYSNIDDPNALVSLIVVKALAKTSIARLANFDVSGLNKQASEVLSSATKTLSSATDMMMKTGSGTGTAVQETAKQAATGVQEAAKDAAETVKNILPFGKK